MPSEAFIAVQSGPVERLADYRLRNPDAALWAAGYGPISHSLETQDRVFALADKFAERDAGGPLFGVLAAADRVACAAMWIVVHSTYARQAHLDGSPLHADEFKSDPQGHTGGALNM